MEVKAQVTQVSTPPAGSAQPTGRSPAHSPAGPGLVPPTGPIERFMSALIRKLAWSRLSDPRVAVAVSAAGLLLGMLLGATAPNAETLPIKLPLSYLLPSLSHQHVIASLILYASDILACLGLAGMLWAHSQGWRPNPRHLLLVSSAIVAVLVCLTPVGSSDTASYAAYGRIAAQGGNPYVTNPLAWLGHHSAYTQAVGTMWKAQSSVYGPFATVIQSFAASIGGPNVATTVWVLMILNGAVFIGVGIPAAEDLRRPGAGDAVLDREPGPHPAAGERRPSRHVRGGGGDLRHPGRAPRPRCARRRAGRRADRPGLRDKDLCGADRARARLAAAPAA